MKKLPRQFYKQPTLIVAEELLGKYLVRKISKKKLVGKIVETEAYIGPEDRASHAYLPRENFKPISKKRLKSLFRGKNFNTKEFYKNFLRGGGKVTERCKTEYLIGGHIYIYLCYGMYWQLNITTAEAGKPECVLIRALEPIEEEAQNKKLASGPGKLCQWLKLDKSFDGEDLIKSKRIWLEDPVPFRQGRRYGVSRGVEIKSSTRAKLGAGLVRDLNKVSGAGKSQIVAAKRIGIDYAGPWKDKLWRFYLKDNPFTSRQQFP